MFNLKIQCEETLPNTKMVIGSDPMCQQATARLIGIKYQRTDDILYKTHVYKHSAEQKL